MRPFTFSLGLLGMLGLAAALPAQAPGPKFAPPPQLAPEMPPLLYVKLIGPKGMQVTFYRGNAKGQTFDVPVMIGLRPGFSYRVAVSGVPGFENEVFYPSLEVRGSLMLANKLRNMDFPAALVFTAEELARVKADASLKKVIVLERPETAIPQASKADEPLEITVQPNRDPLIEARNRGASLLVLQLGDRKYTPEEMAAQNVPGTMLLPGEKALALPRQNPWVPWACFPVFDPLLGPIHPSELMAIYDGGDTGLQAGVTRDGKIVGLDPADTVARYADSKGKKHLAISNRVGLCVPRFIVFRGESILGNQVAILGPGGTRVANGQAMLHVTTPIRGHLQNQQLEGMGSRTKASGILQTQGTAITGRMQGIQVTASLSGTRTIDSEPAPKAAPAEPLDGPLLIIKWPDRCGGLVGDTITFTLKYTNTGGQPISDIAVTDSLTNRLAYVPGSAKADRNAVFTTQANDAGSLILRWEFPGELLPRESGIVTFQVKIR